MRQAERKQAGRAGLKNTGVGIAGSVVSVPIETKMDRL